MNKITIIITCALGSFAYAGDEPEILSQVPPTDAGRGLVRASKSEIRHYGGHVNQGQVMPYISSRDGGKTWKSEKANDQFPKKWGGIKKEAAAIVYMPKSKKYIMVQPINGYIFMADEIDGEWYSPAADGGKFIPSKEWLTDQSKLYPIPKGWIYRNPLELSSGDIIIPMHKSSEGTRFLISKNEGKTWAISKGVIFVPAFQEKGIDEAPRWRNGGVEGTAVELKNGQVYALVRTDSNMSYESYSRDGGNNWSKPKPSPFYGSLIMSTLGRLQNGKLICLWTNAAPMPELAHGKGSRWEDVFTGRGALHVALSDDEGKSWYGYREVVIDALRDSKTFATDGGDHDRSCHQSEFLELDGKRILVTSGQHPKHTKMIIIDQDWVAETERSTNFAKDGLRDISSQVFIPKIHKVQYNRKPGGFVSESPKGKSKAGVKFGILNDAQLVSSSPAADYRRSGISWNFPLARAGEVSFSLKFPQGSNGCHVSLTDRMFNPCDPSVPQRAVFSIKLAPGEKLGGLRLEAEKAYDFKLRFKGKKCALYLDGVKKPIASLKLRNSEKIGLSYLHFIAAEDADVKADKEPVAGAKSPFFQFEEKGQLHEKSTIVGDFKMKAAR